MRKLKNAMEKAKEEAAGELEGVVTTQPTETVNEPPSLEKMIEDEVSVSGCCVACSVICICTLPLLLVAIPALILAILVRIYYLEIAIYSQSCVHVVQLTYFVLLKQAGDKLHSGDEEKALRMQSVASKLNYCVILGHINCYVAFVLIGLPVIIVYSIT